MSRVYDFLGEKLNDVQLICETIRKIRQGQNNGNDRSMSVSWADSEYNKILNTRSLLEEWRSDGVDLVELYLKPKMSKRIRAQ